MRKMRQVRQGYIDGVVTIHENKSGNVSSFNAIKNATSKADLKQLVKLRYNVKTKRDADLTYAEAHDRTLSLKIVTPYCKQVEVAQYAITEDVLYTIYQVDPDQSEDCMYLYLEEVRKLS